MTTYVFISDLHLSANHPCLTQGFFALLKHYQSYEDVQLYILGDWFNVWLGDDVKNEWLDDIIQHLQQFTAIGHHLYFLVGNRDFALGQTFLDQFQGKLLADHVIFQIGHQNIRIEHGDALCTDDVNYQRFKRIIRSPCVLTILKHLPIRIRQKIAHGFRKKSQNSNQQKLKTQQYIMDINSQAVAEAMQEIDILIHGHTHRPKIHHINAKQQRIVLGDWREYHNAGEAMILEITADGDIHFKKWQF